jgi:hypothetical protein
MKSLRTMVLAIMVAAVSVSATQAFAQQEVDPDHYDQPLAAKAPSHKVTAQHRAQSKVTMASKRSKQRRSHASA